MKVVILGNAKSIHIIKWVNGLSDRSIDVHLISLDSPPSENSYVKNVNIYKLHANVPFGYYTAALELKKLLKMINPDLMNAHYASGYGTLARLSGFHPILLSVWGADVYDFPRKSLLCKNLIVSNLRNADGIGSTSNAMLKVTNRLYTNPHTFITPFGVDTQLFKPYVQRVPTKKIVIGTVKTLAQKYGIDTLINAFSILQAKIEDIPMQLVIVGKGPQENDLKSLVSKLGLNDRVEFLGFIEHSKLVSILQSFDIFVALSRYDSESFGVAIVEASACGLPVVVSDADGPAEVVINNFTGLIVPKNNELAATKAIEELVLDSEKRKRMGQFGRAHVEKNYSWDKSLDTMIEAYSLIIDAFSNCSYKKD